MKRILVLFFAMGLVIGSVSMASATPILWVTDGYLGDIKIADNSQKDLDPAVGAISFALNSSNYWLVISSGITKPAIGTAAEPYLYLSVDTSANWDGKLNVSFSETGFTGARPTGFDTVVSGSVSGAGSTLAINSYYSNADLAFVNGGSLGKFGPFGPGGFASAANTADQTDGSYSLTLAGLFSSGLSGGDSGFKAEINPIASTPEPATMLLLGSGFVGLAALRRKFKK